MRNTIHKVLAGIGAATLTLLAPHVRADGNDDPIVGSWNCTVPPAGGAPAFTLVKNMNAGGTLNEIDTAAPPSQESPTVGVWHRTGRRTYSQKAFQFVWDGAGNWLGTFHYTGATDAITLSADGNEIDIKGVATQYDPSGTLVVSFPFTVHCTRF